MENTCAISSLSALRSVIVPARALYAIVRPPTVTLWCVTTGGGYAGAADAAGVGDAGAGLSAASAGRPPNAHASSAAAGNGAYLRIFTERMIRRLAGPIPRPARRRRIRRPGLRLPPRRARAAAPPRLPTQRHLSRGPHPLQS